MPQLAAGEVEVLLELLFKQSIVQETPEVQVVERTAPPQQQHTMDGGAEDHDSRWNSESNWRADR